MTLVNLQNYLQKFGQWLPISSGDESTTLADVLLSGDAGPLEHAFGGMRRLTLGLTVKLGDGRQIRSGGQVVKNVTGYDVTKLFIGTHGYFGVPITCNLRLFALPEAFQTTVFIANDPLLLLTLAASLIRFQYPLVCMELISLPVLSLKLGHDFSRFGKFALMLRLACQANLAARLEESMTQLGEKYSVRMLKFSASEGDEQLWRDLTRLANDERLEFMDMSVSKSLAAKLLTQLSCIAFGLELRIVAGRFRLFSYDPSAFENVLARLKAIAQLEGESVTVSYPSEQGKLKILFCGHDSAVQTQILHSLKETFDPANRFSPFVEFN